MIRMLKKEAAPAATPAAPKYPGVLDGDGRQRRRGGHGDRRQRGRRRLSDYPVHPDGRGLGPGGRGRLAERERALSPLLRARGRARGGGGDGRDEHDRPPRHQLLEWPGHRLHARVALRGGRQATHLRTERGLPGHDQARAERARGTRRLSRGGRYRVLPDLRQERAGGGRPQSHCTPDRRAVAQPRHLRPGRLPHQPRHRVRCACPSAR